MGQIPKEKNSWLRKPKRDSRNKATTMVPPYVKVTVAVSAMLLQFILSYQFPSPGSHAFVVVAVTAICAVTNVRLPNWLKFK